MSAGLRNRIARLEGASRPGRIILVGVAVAWNPDAGAPGSIEPLSHGRGFQMWVPAEFAADPRAGLDERQRAFLRPEDRVIAVAYVADWGAS